jgi:peroxiredoxin
MIRHAIALLLVVSLGLLSPVRAGEYNKKLSIGDPAPSWQGLPGVDGKKHSLADLKDKSVIVLVVTCNSCPVAVAYEDRIIAFAQKHAQPESKVAVVAVNVNTAEADRLPKMKERAEAKGFSFQYLYDETQQIGKAYGARYTPEFFVLDQDRKIAYMGAMDDSSDPARAKVNYLEQAVQATLKGEKPAPVETLARGCSVKYTRARR